MASESILCITYFDTVLGPNIFYCSAPLNKVEHPDLGRILEFSEAEGSFIFTYRKFQTINHIFSIEGALLWLFLVIILAALASFLPAWNASRLTVREVLAYE